MLKIFVSKMSKYHLSNYFIMASNSMQICTLFTTWSTSKIILCIQLKIDHFKLTTHTDHHSQSVSILFIYANIFSTLDFFTMVTAGQKKFLLSNSVQDEIFVPSCCRKKMIFFLIFCIKYLISTLPLNELLSILKNVKVKIAVLKGRGRRRRQGKNGIIS